MSFFCKKNSNKCLSIILVLFGALFMLASHKLPKYSLVPVDANVVPYFLGGVLIVLAGLLFFVKDDSREDESKVKKGSCPQVYKQLIGFVTAIFLYIVLLETVGFLIITALFIASTTWLLGYRKHVVNIVVAISIPLFFWGLFTFLLKISLPAGILPL